MAGILETKSQLKRRIKMIAKFKKNSRPRWAGAMLLLAVLACIFLTNAYVAKADFEFGEPVNLKSIIPGIDPAHDVICCFSYDGLEIYIWSNRSNGYGNSDLWVLKRASVDDLWNEPENCGPAINSAQEEGAASISADGLTLYFDSNRPGGYGGSDIYMATRAAKNDPWEAAVNIGPKISSSSDETSPWILAPGYQQTVWNYILNHGVRVNMVAPIFGLLDGKLQMILGAIRSISAHR
jgi:hypothetical protein